MKNLKIGKKLIVIFGIVLSLFVGTATVSGFCLVKVASSMDNFYNNQFQVMTTQYAMRTALQATIRYFLWSCTTESDAETEERISSALEQLDIVRAGIPVLQEKFQGDKNLVSNFLTQMNATAPVREKLTEMVRTNQIDASLKLFDEEYVPKITEAQNLLIQIGDFATNRSVQVYKESQRIKNQAIVILVFSVTVSVILTIAFGFYITRNITAPIREIEDAANGLAKGNLDCKVNYESRDELGGLAKSIRTTIKGLSNIIDDIAYMTSALSKGDFTVNSKAEDAYLGSFKPILLSMADMKNHLSSAMLQIGQAANQVSSSSEQVSSAAQSLSQGASEQANSVEELSSTINEISQQVENNAEHAKSANEKADTVGNSIVECNQQMQQMIQAMANINDASSEIGKIIKTIEDIAFQTNILALNAAVEAARAGAAGKGFAVVADEVRNLASKSADASKNTSQLIENSLRAVEDGTKIADLTAKSLLATVEGVKDVTATIGEISIASNSQADSILLVTQGMDQISSVVQTNSATSEESAAASEELAGQAKILKDLVSMFKVDDYPDVRTSSTLNDNLAVSEPAYSSRSEFTSSSAEKY